MKSKIITNATLKINSYFINEVLPVATEIRNQIILEEGCESFELMRETKEPNTIVIFAIYTSKETYDWHLEQDYKKFFCFFKRKTNGSARSDSSSGN